MTTPLISRYATSRLKVTWEWLLALALLVLCLPLLGLCLVCVLWDDGRPIFFHQPRVGKNGRLFRVVKLRTMRAIPGPSVTAGNDARITRAGRFLRSAKLDELPQLWNVLKGDMGLVGPRPEVPEFVAPHSPEWSVVLRVRPGVTGAAALRYRQEAALLAEVSDPAAYYRKTLLPAKLSLELRYLRMCSFSGDLRLLWKTGTSFYVP
jgi:lipopolysaccharide/colanic/teichoic acid biosynthesis glycosyltransferase